MTLIHVHAPQPTDKKLNYGKCPDCKRNSWFACFHTPWYGWDTTCLRCGRNWADGQWMDLPFMRGSRQKSIEAAKRRYRRTAV